LLYSSINIHIAAFSPAQKRLLIVPFHVDVHKLQFEFLSFLEILLGSLVPKKSESISTSASRSRSTSLSFRLYTAGFPMPSLKRMSTECKIYFAFRSFLKSPRVSNYTVTFQSFPICHDCPTLASTSPSTPPPFCLHKIDLPLSYLEWVSRSCKFQYGFFKFSQKSFRISLPWNIKIELYSSIDLPLHVVHIPPVYQRLSIFSSGCTPDDEVILHFSFLKGLLGSLSKMSDLLYLASTSLSTSLPFRLHTRDFPFFSMSSGCKKFLRFFSFSKIFKISLSQNIKTYLYFSNHASIHISSFFRHHRENLQSFLLKWVSTSSKFHFAFLTRKVFQGVERFSKTVLCMI
uniref:Maturase K n=1 Tax=Haemonchus placei TaxID=6290 RepID=A0A0N4WQR3_HAEPC